MTPAQKVKWLILLKAIELENIQLDAAEITESNIDEIYEKHEQDDWSLQDAKSEVRGGQVETNIPSEWSRHYEIQSVAAKSIDNSWVGWPYYFGGGKHSEPDAVEWINKAYDLDCKEEEKLVIVREFSRKT